MADHIDADARRGVVLAGRGVARVLALLVLVKAAMAGNSKRLFGRLSIVAHGAAGQTSFGLAVVGLVITIVGRFGRSAIAVSATLVALMMVQISLGYSGRTSLDAAAWHIPNGVAIFGVAVYNITLYQRRGPPKP